MLVELEHELDVFHRELPRLLADERNRGKFVLICGDTVAGVYDSRSKALDAGYERFDLRPFLVKEITDHEKPKYFSRNIKRCP
jgi:hypothetical protein